MEVIELLAKGKEALLADDRDLARDYFDKAYETDKSNQEARMFWMLTTAFLFVDDADGAKTIAKVLYMMRDDIVPAMQSIADEDKNESVLLMVDLLATLSVELLKEFPTVFESRILEVYKGLSKEIVDILGVGEDASAIALKVWKDTIFLRHHYCAYRNFQDKNKQTWYDVIINNIKELDPSYEPPQFEQAGCLMFGDKARESAKVKPGE